MFYITLTGWSWLSSWKSRYMGSTIDPQLPLFYVCISYVSLHNIFSQNVEAQNKLNLLSYNSECQESETGLVGSFLKQVCPAAVKLSAGATAHEGFNGARRPASKKAHSHGWWLQLLVPHLHDLFARLRTRRLVFPGACDLREREWGGVSFIT